MFDHPVHNVALGPLWSVGRGMEGVNGDSRGPILGYNKCKIMKFMACVNGDGRVMMDLRAGCRELSLREEK